MVWLLVFSSLKRRAERGQHSSGRWRSEVIGGEKMRCGLIQGWSTTHGADTGISKEGMGGMGPQQNPNSPQEESWSYGGVKLILCFYKILECVNKWVSESISISCASSIVLFLVFCPIPTSLFLVYFYFIKKKSCLFSHEIQKCGRSTWDGRWEGSMWSRRSRNDDTGCEIRNILHLWRHRISIGKLLFCKQLEYLNLSLPPSSLPPFLPPSNLSFLHLSFRRPQTRNLLKPASGVLRLLACTSILVLKTSILK